MTQRHACLFKTQTARPAPSWQVPARVTNRAAAVSRERPVGEIAHQPPRMYLVIESAYLDLPPPPPAVGSVERGLARTRQALVGDGEFRRDRCGAGCPRTRRNALANVGTPLQAESHRRSPRGIAAKAALVWLGKRRGEPDALSGRKHEREHLLEIGHVRQVCAAFTQLPDSAPRAIGRVGLGLKQIRASGQGVLKLIRHGE